MSANNQQANPNKKAPLMPDDLYRRGLDLFYIPSTMYNEKSVSFYIVDMLNDMRIPYTIDDYGNILITKGTGLYACFSAHLDTVHIYKNGFKLLYQEKSGRKYLYACDKDKKPVGVGGDDKCGIFVCLYLLQKIDNIKIVFFSQEESGGVGSSNIDLKFFDDCKFLCSVDRWNGHDFINKYGGQYTISKQFNKDIKPLLKKYDYSFNSGLFTDCFNVMERDVNICCFNLSCGYYSHHSSNEYVDLNELYNCCLLCEELAGLPVRYEHELIKKYFPVTLWGSSKKQGGFYGRWQNDDIYNKADDYDYKQDYCNWCGIELLSHEKEYCETCRREIERDEYFNKVLDDKNDFMY